MQYIIRKIGWADISEGFSTISCPIMKEMVRDDLILTPKHRQNIYPKTLFQRELSIRQVEDDLGWLS